MYRTVIATVAAVALIPGVASASTVPPGTDEGGSTTVGADGGEGSTADESSTGMQAAASQPATVFDESGEAVASITAGDAQLAWSGYAEDNAPDEGQEYFRLRVTVESLVEEDAFAIAVDDFILQNSIGFVTTAESVASESQAEDEEDITEEAELANGESVELDLTFPMDANTEPRSVFYRPDDERLVGVADVSQS